MRHELGRDDKRQVQAVSLQSVGYLPPGHGVGCLHHAGVAPVFGVNGVCAQLGFFVTLAQEYVATVESRVTAAQLRALSSGAEVEGVKVVPVAVEVMEAGSNQRPRVRIIVREGRKREV